MRYDRISALTGATASTISRYFANEDAAKIPRYLETLILVWELLSREQKDVALAAVEALPPPRKIRRARNLPMDAAGKPKKKPAAK